MSKFDEFEVSNGGSDRIYYKNSMLPMGGYATAFNFVLVTWQRGRLPIVFSSCDFEGCVFDRVDLRFAVFLNCTFKRCVFKHCQLDMASFIDCNGRDLTIRHSHANSTLLWHCMIDGISLLHTGLRDSRISVNTEYLAPIHIVRCDLDDAYIQNIASMQYESPYGVPTLSESDRRSVKIDRCVGRYDLVGFQYV